MKEWVDRYLRNDIKIIRYDTRFKKNLMIVARDSLLLILIIWVLINQEGKQNDRNNND